MWTPKDERGWSRDTLYHKWKTKLLFCVELNSAHPLAWCEVIGDDLQVVQHFRGNQILVWIILLTIYLSKCYNFSVIQPGYLIYKTT